MDINKAFMGRWLASLLLVATFGANAASHTLARPASAPEFPFPTVHNISWVWHIENDEDLNSIVRVRYRPSGTTVWKQGMEVRRVPPGSYTSSSGKIFSWGHRHAGSLFDLQPNTQYEIVLELWDYDSKGRLVRAATTEREPLVAKTRPEPSLPASLVDGRSIVVTHANFRSAIDNLQPGQLLELVPDPTPYPGFSLTHLAQSGREDAPIVIRTHPGYSSRAVIGGEVSLNHQTFVHLDRLEVRHRIRINNTKNIALTRNIVRISAATNRNGIESGSRSENAYIADNAVLGPVQWRDDEIGKNSKFLKEGIVVTGPGHVIMNNHVKGFYDGISLLSNNLAVDQFSIDILNNELEVFGDDAIETDYCFHNCRVMRNSIRNTLVALSSQPSLGGPTLFIRNVMYNVVLTPFKLHLNSIGNMILHNTLVKNGDALGIYTEDEFKHTLFRNNLSIGGPPYANSFGGYRTGAGRVIYFEDADLKTLDLNYEAFGSAWSPTDANRFWGRIGDDSVHAGYKFEFRSLDELKRQLWNHGIDAGNVIEARLDSFSSSVPYPSNPSNAYPMPNLSIKAGSPPQDKAQYLPNVNDGFSGSAPDIGAYEVGAALPVYGPRSSTTTVTSTQSSDTSPPN